MREQCDYDIETLRHDRLLFGEILTTRLRKAKEMKIWVGGTEGEKRIIHEKEMEVGRESREGSSDKSPAVRVYRKERL